MKNRKKEGENGECNKNIGQEKEARQKAVEGGTRKRDEARKEGKHQKAQRNRSFENLLTNFFIFLISNFWLRLHF